VLALAGVGSGAYLAGRSDMTPTADRVLHRPSTTITTTAASRTTSSHHTTTTPAPASSTSTTATTSAVSASTTTTTLPLPLVVDCGSDRLDITPEYEPSRFVLACGDGQTSVIDITWSSWSASRALGTGLLYNWNALSGATSSPTSIVLTDPLVSPYCTVFCLGTPARGLIFTTATISGFDGGMPVHLPG
jgi:hypothetical protein